MRCGRGGLVSIRRWARGGLWGRWQGRTSRMGRGAGGLGSVCLGRRLRRDLGGRSVRGRRIRLDLVRRGFSAVMQPRVLRRRQKARKRRGCRSSRGLSVPEFVDTGRRARSRSRRWADLVCTGVLLILVIAQRRRRPVMGRMGCLSELGGGWSTCLSWDPRPSWSGTGNTLSVCGVHGDDRDLALLDMT